MNYNSKALDELCDVKIGRTPPRNQPEWFNSGASDDWKWVSIKDMGNCGKFITTTSETITDKAKETFNYATVASGTILLSFKLTLGRVVICDGEFVTNEAIAQLPIKDPSTIDRDYLYYYLKNYNWSNIGNTSSIATAVNSKMVKGIKIDFPDLGTQKKIVRILSALDQKIELNNSINRVLYSLAESIFKERFKDKKYGDRTVGDYITPKRGKALLSKDTIEGPVPVVAGGLEAAAHHNKSNTSAPVVTISASGANAGFVRLWGEKVWSSDSSFIDDSITKNVYFWYVLLKSRQKEIYDAQTGSAQAHIYPKHIADMSIGDINDEEISKYNILVTPMFEKIALNDATNIELSATRDSLLPKLMSGEIIDR